MSYCVNCGVELDDSAIKCALCDTPVYIPGKIHETSLSPFPEKVVIPKNIQRRFISYIITVVMLIPNIIMFFVNLSLPKSGFWSIYVMSTSFLLWTFFVFPFYTKKVHPYIWWAADTIVTALYTYVFFIMNSNQPWMFSTIYSIIFLLSLSSLIFIAWIRKKRRHWTAIVAHILLDLTLMSLIVGTVATLLSGIFGFFIAGLTCFLCFISLFGFFLYCNRSKRVRAWLSKAFYI